MCDEASEFGYLKIALSIGETYDFIVGFMSCCMGIWVMNGWNDFGGTVHCRRRRLHAAVFIGQRFLARYQNQTQICSQTWVSLRTQTQTQMRSQTDRGITGERGD